jgi:hypothetical protein
MGQAVGVSRKQCNPSPACLATVFPSRSPHLQLEKEKREVSVHKAGTKDVTIGITYLDVAEGGWIAGVVMRVAAETAGERKVG